MSTLLVPLILLAALPLTFDPQEPPAVEAPFPASTAIAESLSPDALAALDALVRSFVDDGEIVGAELLVLKNGRTVLHEGYGWRDREAQLPMQPGGVFCVRSMTKPLVGAAILMLAQDGLLELDDTVASHLRAFDVEGKRKITVEQLLTHTSGLPMSEIFTADLTELDGIRAVAELGAGGELGFEPGTSFHYSDQGTDTLTALIEIVSGLPAAEFVRTRVLTPLGMVDSACVLAEGHPLRDRAGALYVGSRGAWVRYWGPDEAPMFPFFLGSQGLYSTCVDYARFLEFWRTKGRAGGERLLRARFVRKALRPGPHPMEGVTGFPGLRSAYGFLMQELWTASGEGGKDDELVAFGHTGSDGTHAWAFPKERAMVLYFTQSRGGKTGLRVEEALGELILGVPFDPNQAAPPFEDYLGYYFEGEGDIYRAIVRDGDDLALEILGQGVVALTYAGEDRWKFRDNPSKVVAFDRSETGEVTGYHIGDHQEFRFQPSSELPTAEDLAQRVAQLHRLDLVESAGPVRFESDLNMLKLGITGQLRTVLEWPDRFRIDSVAGEEFERLAYDGHVLRYVASNKDLAPIEGARAALLLPDNPFARFGDLHRWFPRLTVIQRIERREDASSEPEQIYLVRAGDVSAPARTLYIHSSGRIIRIDGLTHIETLGRIGQRVTFGEYREASGMFLPHRSMIQLANPLIGKIEIRLAGVELGVELAEGTFELGE